MGGKAKDSSNAALVTLTKEISDGIKTLLGRQVSIMLEAPVKYEIQSSKKNSDENLKLDDRILVFCPCRLFCLKVHPLKIDFHYHYLEIKTFEVTEKSQQVKKPKNLEASQLTLKSTVNDKTHNFYLPHGDNENDPRTQEERNEKETPHVNFDAMMYTLMDALTSTFPGVPISTFLTSTSPPPIATVPTKIFNKSPSSTLGFQDGSSKKSEDNEETNSNENSNSATMVTSSNSNSSLQLPMFKFKSDKSQMDDDNNGFELIDKISDRQKSLEDLDEPCGGFGTQYAWMCDLLGVPYWETVVKDVNNIYAKAYHDLRRILRLRDFQESTIQVIQNQQVSGNPQFDKAFNREIMIHHQQSSPDQKNAILSSILSPLQYNTYFTGIDLSSSISSTNASYCSHQGSSKEHLPTIQKENDPLSSVMQTMIHSVAKKSPALKTLIIGSSKHSKDHYILLGSQFHYNAEFDGANPNRHGDTATVSWATNNGSYCYCCCYYVSRFKSDFLVKLDASLAESEERSKIDFIDFSGNAIEDKGSTSLCKMLGSLQNPVKYLNLCGCGITNKGINQIAMGLCTTFYERSPEHTNSREKVEILPQASAKDTMTHLLLAHNNFKEESSNACGFNSLFNFLAQPNVLTHLDLGGTDIGIERVFGALLRGCTTNLVWLNLTRNNFSPTSSTHTGGSGQKKNSTGGREIAPSFKQFLSSTLALKYLNLSWNKICMQALKELLLGLSCNENTVDIELDISGNNLGQNGGVQILESCLPGLISVSSINISDNNFDADLGSVITAAGKNKAMKRLNISRNLVNAKSKHIVVVMDALVNLIQDPTCPLESLIFSDAKLKSDMYSLISALAGNQSLKYVDISGNQIGDMGARLLTKMIQLNKTLECLSIDRNSISVNGYNAIAYGMESNTTIKEFPYPVYDVMNCMTNKNSEHYRTEGVLRKIQHIVQRNFKIYEEAQVYGKSMHKNNQNLTAQHGNFKISPSQSKKDGFRSLDRKGGDKLEEFSDPKARNLFGGRPSSACKLGSPFDGNREPGTSLDSSPFETPVNLLSHDLVKTRPKRNKVRAPTRNKGKNKITGPTTQLGLGTDSALEPNDELDAGDDENENEISTASSINSMSLSMSIVSNNITISESINDDGTNTLVNFDKGTDKSNSKSSQNRSHRSHHSSNDGSSIASIESICSRDDEEPKETPLVSTNGKIDDSKGKTDSKDGKTDLPDATKLNPTKNMTWKGGELVKESRNESS